MGKLGATWLATVLFTAGIYGGALLAGYGPLSAALVAVPSLIVTPLVWWFVVKRGVMPRPGRGFIAGALIVPMVWISAVAISHVLGSAARPSHGRPNPEWIAFGYSLKLLLALAGSLIGAVPGGVFGAMVAWADGHITRDRSAHHGESK